MAVQKFSLFFSEGSSDKEYHAEITEYPDGYRVLFHYGRRGGTLAHGEKTTQSVPLAEAQKIFEKLKKEKMAKGYTESESGVAYQGNEKAGLISGETLTLLTKVDESVMNDLLKDPDYYFQQKVDGERRAIRKQGGEVVGINKQNMLTPLPVNTMNSLLKIVDSSVYSGGDFAFDAELVGETLYVFDVLTLNGQTVRQQSFSSRSKLLDTLFEKATEQSDLIVKVDTARTWAEKQVLLDRIKAHDLEGVAIKHRAEPYDQAAQYKHKNYEECTVVITGLNDGKRSASMALLQEKGDGTIEVGNLTIPPNAPLPSPGDHLEVKYLYGYEGGSLFQPVYNKPRPDVTSPDRIDSIKYKPTSQHIKPKM